MFNEFQDLHDSRKSDSIQYFSFYDVNGDLIRGDSITVSTNISNQTIYSWYLVPKETIDYFSGTRKGIFRESDINITNTGILTFYKEFLDTIEVVEFRKDRNSFNVV